MEKMVSVWVAADPGESVSAIRDQAERENEALQLSGFSLSLPSHISLKISFPVAESLFDAVVERITALLSGKSGFSVPVKGLERQENILWIAMGESKELSALHEMLDACMEREFAVERHAFDRCYQFHSTLFMDGNEEKMAEMERRLQAFPLPAFVQVEGFMIGCSREEEPGVYRVIRRFA